MSETMQISGEAEPVVYLWDFKHKSGFVTPLLSDKEDPNSYPVYRAAPAPAWQLIETAPKDGTEVLLWWKHCKTPSVGAWSIDDMHAERQWAHKALEEGWRCEGDACIPVNQADCTHWQPLPAGPESAQPTTAISSKDGVSR